ncbi:chaoptin-like [Drosophila serrata]|uniref:chaoptin-like n=1 Tax=Drosophila serrata TaxID=7274 RepID=UPI000A1D2F69|nr:chaoptin-like [Drosophila serrata]
MNYTLYILLIPTTFVLGLTDLSISSTETDATSAVESEMELLSLDPDLRELQLNECNNLTIMELTPNLRILEIFNCFWLRLEMKDLSVVGNLSSLQFRNGTLLRLEEKMFLQLPLLETLGLGENGIAVVSPDAFIGLTQLWMLTLNDNRIVYFEERVFHPLVKLRYLDLRGNTLFNLPEDIFNKNPKMQVLFLNGNHLSSVYPSTLAILKKLNMLDLSDNFINELQLPSSKTIIVDNIGVYRMDVPGNVSTFQARNNFLTYLYFENQICVTELDLHGNKLTTKDITDILKGMWRLYRLDLSSNLAKALPTLEPSKFDGKEDYILPILKFVNMSRNLLEHLRGDSHLLSPSLTHLDLSHNRICEQEGLKEVALFDNEFSYITYTQIIEYFRNAGIQVLGEFHSEGFTSVKEKSSMMKCFRAKIINDDFVAQPSSEELIDELESNELEHRQLNTFRKWSSWKILILLGLLAALTSNIILVIQLRRSRGRLNDNRYLLE